jgi:hypothetical protein
MRRDVSGERFSAHRDRGRSYGGRGMWRCQRSKGTSVPIKTRGPWLQSHFCRRVHCLRNRSVAAGSILALALGAAVFGSTYILPMFTQSLLGFTPNAQRRLFILRAVPNIIVAPIFVRLTGKIDPSRVRRCCS